MKINLKTTNTKDEIVSSVYNEFLTHLDNRDFSATKALVSGLCAGFMLGKDAAPATHEAFEEMVCDLIVKTMELDGLLCTLGEE